MQLMKPSCGLCSWILLPTRRWPSPSATTWSIPTWARGAPGRTSRPHSSPPQCGVIIKLLWGTASGCWVITHKNALTEFGTTPWQSPPMLGPSLPASKGRPAWCLTHSARSEPIALKTTTWRGRRRTPGTTRSARSFSASIQPTPPSSLGIYLDSYK